MKRNHSEKELIVDLDSCIGCVDFPSRPLQLLKDSGHVAFLGVLGVACFAGCLPLIRGQEFALAELFAIVCNCLSLKCGTVTTLPDLSSRWKVQIGLIKI